MASAARILWTKQLTKKKKTYNDGFIRVKPSNEAILYDEDGKELSCCSKLPSGIDITTDDDIRCFEGYLVQGDCACDPSEIKGSLSCYASTTSATSSQYPAAATYTTSYRPQQQPQQPSVAPCLSRRRRSITAPIQQAAKAPPAALLALQEPVSNSCVPARAAGPPGTAAAWRPTGQHRTADELDDLLSSLAPTGTCNPWRQPQQHQQQHQQQQMPYVPQVGRLTRPRKSQQQQQLEPQQELFKQQQQHADPNSNNISLWRQSAIPDPSWDSKDGTATAAASWGTPADSRMGHPQQQQQHVEQQQQQQNPAHEKQAAPVHCPSAEQPACAYRVPISSLSSKSWPTSSAQQRNSAIDTSTGLQQQQQQQEEEVEYNGGKQQQVRLQKTMNSNSWRSVGSTSCCDVVSNPSSEWPTVARQQGGPSPCWQLPPQQQQLYGRDALDSSLCTAEPQQDPMQQQQQQQQGRPASKYSSNWSTPACTAATRQPSTILCRQGESQQQQQQEEEEVDEPQPEACSAQYKAVPAAGISAAQAIARKRQAPSYGASVSTNTAVLAPGSASGRRPLHTIQQQQQQQRSAAGTIASDTVSAENVTAADSGSKLLMAKKAGTFVAPRLKEPAAGRTALSVRPQQQQQQQGSIMGYAFPTAGSQPPLRRIAIPTMFRSAADYVAALLSAMTEEVNLQLAEHARTFHTLVQYVTNNNSNNKNSQQQGLRHGPQQQQQQQQKLGGSCGPRALGSATGCTQQGLDLNHLQALCNRINLQYHPNCTLTVYYRSQSTIAAWAKGKNSKCGKKGAKARGKAAAAAVAAADDDACSDDDGGQQIKAVSMYLTLSGKIDRRKFRKHDLWVLSNNPLMTTTESDKPGDRLNKPWTVIARSVWHGPDKDGKMEVEVLPGQLPQHHKWQRQQQLAALLAPDLATEVQIADFLSSSDLRDWPLIRSLLHGVQGQDSEAAAAAATDSMVSAAAAADCDVIVAAAAESSAADAGAADTAACGSACEQLGSSSSSDDDDGSDDDMNLFESLQPQHRHKKARKAAATAGADDFTADCAVSETSGASNSTQLAALATDAKAAAQQLLADVVERFKLNSAQAEVAAHVADWLPELTKQPQQQQSAAGPSRTGSAVQGLSRKHMSAINRQNLTSSYSSIQATTAAADVARTASSGSSRLPTCLIHGPFGSGKSTLLVALVHLLTGLSGAQQDSNPNTKKRKLPAGQNPSPQRPRILVAAHTNVAVDRVLLALLESGFTDMLRVGSLQRIAKKLLSYSVHSADDRRDAVGQLQAMLQEAQGTEAELIKQELAQLQAGAERQRRKKLATAAVVGVTCCSALQATLEGQVFDIVVLDEASQMTEATSMVPLIRAKPRFVIAAGDPCQLPPVLASPSTVTPTQVGSSSSNNVPGSQHQHQQHVYGLLRPLFVRLTHMGHTPHLLTHQYRCHPALSALSNKHFYNSRLIDGVSAGQRSALVAGLGPLVFCDCQGGRSQSADSGSRSSVNRTEAQMVVQLVLAVLKCRSSSNGGILAQQQQQQQGGILSQQQCREQRGGNAMHDSDIEDSISEEGPSAGNHRQQQQQQDDEEGDGAGHEGQAPAVHAHQLGVICFFKAQATLIRQLLAAAANACPGAADVQVATVDSFQGAERQVIILATTTTNPRSEFCSDAARLNVALTRAKRHLIVVGAAGVLTQTSSAVLRDLVWRCRREGAWYPGGSILGLPGLAAGRQ